MTVHAFNSIESTPKGNIVGLVVLCCLRRTPFGVIRPFLGRVNETTTALDSGFVNKGFFDFSQNVLRNPHIFRDLACHLLRECRLSP